MRSLLLLGLLTLPAIAQANDIQDLDAAKERFRIGQTHYASGDFAGALREFEAARVIKPIPEFDYNIAVCQERLDHPRDAIASFRTYLAETTDPAAIADTKERISKLEAQMAAVPPPAAKIEIAPPAPALPISSPPVSYTVPVAVGVGALALAAIGVSLFLPAAHEYDQISGSWSREQTPELAMQADYVKTRVEASYAVFGVAGVVAVIDIILFARAGRANREGARVSPARAWLGSPRRAAGFPFAGTF